MQETRNSVVTCPHLGFENRCATQIWSSVEPPVERHPDEAGAAFDHVRCSRRIRSADERNMLDEVVGREAQTFVEDRQPNIEVRTHVAPAMGAQELPTTTSNQVVHSVVYRSTNERVLPILRGVVGVHAG